MKIVKFGHCCLLVEEQGLRILTDPGNYSDGQDYARDIGIVLITHEHKDHFNIDSLKRVLKNNPGVKIITNKSVGELLGKESINYAILNNGGSTIEGGISIEGFGEKHAVIHPDLPQVENVGYLINNRFFYPGDAFTRINRDIEILALPVAATWLKLSETIQYAREMKPKICFPVHDGILKMPESLNKNISELLKPAGIKFIIPRSDGEIEIS